MATKKKGSSRRAYGGATGRAKPMTSKNAVTRNRGRRYDTGGKTKG